MPEKEIAICHRLREARKAKKFSQVVAAGDLGIDSSLLASYEHARAPLRSGIAWKALSLYSINPIWLYKGAFQCFVACPPELLKPLKEQENQLFSKVFEESLGPVLRREAPFLFTSFDQYSWKVHLEGPDDQARRNALVSINNVAKAWCAKVPRESLNEFINQLFNYGETLALTYPFCGLDEFTRRLAAISEKLNTANPRSKPTKR